MPEGKLLWEPDSGFVRKTAMTAYTKWLENMAADDRIEVRLDAD